MKAVYDPDVDLAGQKTTEVLSQPTRLTVEMVMKRRPLWPQCEAKEKVALNLGKCWFSSGPDAQSWDVTCEKPTRKKVTSLEAFCQMCGDPANLRLVLNVYRSVYGPSLSIPT
jgi:hypothetical protein